MRLGSALTEGSEWRAHNEIVEGEGAWHPQSLEATGDPARLADRVA